LRDCSIPSGKILVALLIIWIFKGRRYFGICISSYFLDQQEVSFREEHCQIEIASSLLARRFPFSNNINSALSELLRLIFQHSKAFLVLITFLNVCPQLVGCKNKYGCVSKGRSKSFNLLFQHIQYKLNTFMLPKTCRLFGHGTGNLNFPGYPILWHRSDMMSRSMADPKVHFLV